MEDHHSNPFSLEFFYPEEGMEEIRHSLPHTTFGLETLIMEAKQEITRREHELFHLKDLLCKVIKTKDEARAKCRMLMSENKMLQQQLQQKQHRHQHKASNPQTDNGQSKGSESMKYFASSCTNRLSRAPLSSPKPSQDVVNLKANTSPALISSNLQQQPVTHSRLGEKQLPEKGKLLKAVIEAGPLLQTLLLVGPLPCWQNPPPELDPTEIPAVDISPHSNLLHQNSCNSMSRSFSSNNHNRVFVV